jgi:hypothetical protein
MPRHSDLRKKFVVIMDYQPFDGIADHSAAPFRIWN